MSKLSQQSSKPTPAGVKQQPVVDIGHWLREQRNGAMDALAQTQALLMTSQKENEGLKKELAALKEAAGPKDEPAPSDEQ
jgi:hypothetical protein